jgi:hypothetical protein
MDVEGRTIWQIGTGDTERSYGHIFQTLDIMAVGPGWQGKFEGNEKAYSQEPAVCRFYQKSKKNDIVLLRKGNEHVLAVGIIADEKPIWIEEFGDVDGFMLQHTRRVRWLPNSEKKFPQRTLGVRPGRFAAVGVDVVKRWVKRLKVSDKALNRRLARLPKLFRKMTDIELGKELSLEGLPKKYIKNLVSRLSSIRRAALWYQNEEIGVGRPSEEETINNLVMPFLSALGWSYQTVGIEWRNIDIALFEKMPSEDKSLVCVIEVKKIDKSVLNHFEQARDYAVKHGREKCSKLVVTDGIRYAFYRKRIGGFRLDSYFNLLVMQKAYPLYRCRGAVDVIIGMANKV